jgi:hypothetical protein
MTAGSQIAKSSPTATIGQRCGLDDHAGDDQWLAADPVRERTSDQLPGAPDGRIDGGEDAYAFKAEAGGSEQYREQAPGQSVVEVVHHAGLADGGQ